MENNIILIDTSILIDLFRKTEKANAILISLVKQGFAYKISAITDYEIYIGANANQLEYWNSFLEKTEVLSFDKYTAKKAVEINNLLKQKNKQIAIPDLFIAATALHNNLPLATLNKKHFQNINNLLLIN